MSPVAPMVHERPIDSKTKAASSLIESGNKASQVTLFYSLQCTVWSPAKGLGSIIAGYRIFVVRYLFSFF